MLFSAMKLTQKEGFKEKPSKSIPNKSIITVVCPILPGSVTKHALCWVSYYGFMFGFTTACPHPIPTMNSRRILSSRENQQPTAPTARTTSLSQITVEHSGAVAFQNQMLGKPNIKPSCSVYINIYIYIYMYVCASGWVCHAHLVT